MISTHVLDTATGEPGSRIPVELDVFITGRGWRQVGHGITNNAGSILDFGEPSAPGLYRLMFDIAACMPHAFFPSITVTFEVRDPLRPVHVPVLVSPYGYTVHRDGNFSR